MTKPNRLVLKECLWVCGESLTRAQRHAEHDLNGLRERGMEIFMFRGRDPECLKQLAQLLLKKEKHVIFSWLLPFELNLVYPLVKERKNFSIVADDWWIQPFPVMRDADYIIFRKYQGIAVRRKQIKFTPGDGPPLLLNPSPHISKYALICMAARPLALAASPFVSIWNAWRRTTDTPHPNKFLFFPFAVNCGARTPVKELQPEYDFANTAGTFGSWFMRDPHAPFHLSFGNLYHDRKLLVDGIARYENNPFKFYDCRREKNFWLPYDVYMQKSQQSRFAVVSGGLHDAALVKYLEFARTATPMIGRRVPFEHPWLEDCMIHVDMMRMPANGLKPVLDEAMDRYPVLKQNCLNWREKIYKLYDFHTLFDMLEEQTEGKPIRPGYIKPEPGQIAN